MSGNSIIRRGEDNLSRVRNPKKIRAFDPDAGRTVLVVIMAVLLKTTRSFFLVIVKKNVVSIIKGDLLMGRKKDPNNFFIKCKNCGRPKGDHSSGKCPIGEKRSIGYTRYHPTKVFK